MEPFEDIDNMTIERYHNNYIKSHGDQQYRLVVLGVWTIDIKERLKMLSDEKDNTDLHYIVIRGTTHLRARPENSQRFGAGSLTAPLTKRKITEEKNYSYDGDT